MNNKDALFWFNKIDTVKKELDSFIEQSNKLDNEIAKREDILFEIDEFSENYKGIILKTLDGNSWSAVDSSITRHGSVYKNAHNKRTWGAHLQEYGGHIPDETWLGAGWKTKKELVEIIKEYVAFGAVPKERH